MRRYYHNIDYEGKKSWCLDGLSNLIRLIWMQKSMSIKLTLTFNACHFMLIHIFTWWLILCNQSIANYISTCKSDEVLGPKNNRKYPTKTLGNRSCDVPPSLDWSHIVCAADLSLWTSNLRDQSFICSTVGTILMPAVGRCFPCVFVFNLWSWWLYPKDTGAMCWIDVDWIFEKASLLK